MWLYRMVGDRRLHERCVTWVFEVHWRTPGYIVNQEMQRDKLRTRAGKGAWRFEENLKQEIGRGRG